MMTDDELAALRKGVPVDVAADGTPADPMLSLMSEVVMQVTRIANNTGRPTLNLTRLEVHKAWDSTGMRMYEDRFVDALKALGIEVEP